MNSGGASVLIWVLSAVIALAGAVLLVHGPARPVQEDVLGGVAGAAFLLVSVLLQPRRPAEATPGAVDAV